MNMAGAPEGGMPDSMPREQVDDVHSAYFMAGTDALRRCNDDAE